jgi:hypothetical protein
MYYEINVSLNGRHFFATAKRSLRTRDEAEQCLKKILESFTKPEGYRVSISLITEQSQHYELSEFLQ